MQHSTGVLMWFPLVSISQSYQSETNLVRGQPSCILLMSLSVSLLREHRSTQLCIVSDSVSRWLTSVFCWLLWQVYAATQPYGSQAVQSQQMPYVSPAPAPYNPNFAFQPTPASTFAAADNRYCGCMNQCSDIETYLYLPPSYHQCSD